MNLKNFINIPFSLQIKFYKLIHTNKFRNQIFIINNFQNINQMVESTKQMLKKFISYEFTVFGKVQSKIFNLTPRGFFQKIHVIISSKIK